MASDEPLLSLPAAIAARRFALANLDRAAGAAERFRLNEDPQALHDFRVGLRRLRATARGYHEALSDSIPKKSRRALKDLAEASTLARDTEVQLEWLEKQHATLRRHEQIGYRWLHRHWQTQLLAEYLQLNQRIGDEFAALDRRLRPRLQATALPEADRPTVAQTLTESLGLLLPRFAEALDVLAESSDPERIHPPRLIGKRLRYLIDPFAQELKGAAALVKAIGNLQDLLGDIHDRQVLQPALMKAAETAGAARYRLLLEVALQRDAGPQVPAPRGSEAAGLTALAFRAQAEEEALMEELHRWLDSGSSDMLVKRLQQLPASLDAPQPSPPQPEGSGC